MNSIKSNVEILQNNLCFRELNDLSQNDLILQLYDGHPLDQVLARASDWLHDIDFKDFGYYMDLVDSNESDIHY